MGMETLVRSSLKVWFFNVLMSNNSPRWVFRSEFYTKRAIGFFHNFDIRFNGHIVPRNCEEISIFWIWSFCDGLPWIWPLRWTAWLHWEFWQSGWWCYRAFLKSQRLLFVNLCFIIISTSYLIFCMTLRSRKHIFIILEKEMLWFVWLSNCLIL